MIKLSLTPLLLLLFVFCAYAGDSSGQRLLDKKITLKLTDQEMRTVFSELEKQCQARFVYSPELIGASRHVSVDVKDKELYKVLSDLLPDDIIFEQVNNYIILSKKP